MDIFIELLGIVLIFAAADIKRDKESQIDLFTVEYFLQTLLIGIGLLLVVNSELAQHALK